MFKSLKDGLSLINISLVVFTKHPKFLLPLLTTWIIYASSVIYIKYILDWDHFSESETAMIVLAVIFSWAVMLSLSCSILLELIQQIETGGKPSILKAVFDTLTVNFLRLLPIIVLWSLIWFMLVLLETIFSKQGNDDDEEMTAENVAETLAGFESISLSDAFFQALQKGVRMVAFLIYPGVVWENLGPIAAFKKGIAVFKLRIKDFISGYLLTEMAATIIYTPLIIVFVIRKAHFELPDIVWYLVIIYVGFAWSFSIYLEQMFVAELYLWHLKWEEACKTAQKSGKRLPSLNNVKPPSILDDVPDLLPIQKRDQYDGDTNIPT
ncbi:MAG: hypothetical protein ACM3UZ_10770 [Acidobacteriota bacterium]